jgi:hypothetical protein
MAPHVLHRRHSAEFCETGSSSFSDAALIGVEVMMINRTPSREPICQFNVRSIQASQRCSRQKEAAWTPRATVNPSILRDDGRIGYTKRSAMVVCSGPLRHGTRSIRAWNVLPSFRASLSHRQTAWKSGTCHRSPASPNRRCSPTAD